MDPAIRLLRELVAIDSVNPALVPGASGEAAIAEAIAAELHRIGLDVDVHEAAPGRPNVVGILDGRSPGRSIMFCGHVDTVGVDGMEAPFEPVQRDGRLYGRGAQDMKSGVAAMIDAARVLAESGLERGRVIVAAVVDEEYASIGADALVTRWRTDAAVVTEPTDLDIAIGHKGFAWTEIRTTGRAAHGSRPRDGRDAIMHMGRVLTSLEALDRALQSSPGHPLLGTASLHASLIEGGRELSSYPDSCLLKLERRTLPGETDTALARELDTLLAALRSADPEFEVSAAALFSRPAYEVAAEHELPKALREAYDALDGEAFSPDEAFSPGKALSPRPRSGPRRRGGEIVGMSFWTDAAVLGSVGIPSVLFGPGGAGLHSTEEYVNVDDVLLCRETLVALARAWTSR